MLERIDALPRWTGKTEQDLRLERERARVLEQAKRRVEEWVNQKDNIRVVDVDIPLEPTPLSDPTYRDYPRLNPPIHIDYDYIQNITRRKSKHIWLRELLDLVSEYRYYIPESVAQELLFLNTPGSIVTTADEMRRYGYEVREFQLDYEVYYGVLARPLWVWQEGGQVWAVPPPGSSGYRQMTWYITDLFRSGIPFSEEFITELLGITGNSFRTQLRSLNQAGVDIQRERLFGESIYVYNGTDPLFYLE